MWLVQFESKKVENEVTEMKNSGVFTSSELEVIQQWIRSVSLSGPESIRRGGLWNDHALEHEWLGYRSSSFSNRGRIIYEIVGDKVLIQIARITKTHNYKK